MSRITVQFNFFGPFLKKEEIEKILDPKVSNLAYQHQRDLFKWFFELPFNSLSREVIERYVEITTEESHCNIVPHTKEIFERLLKPLKSAKKNYCLNDYSATIALCGTVGEMLAILLWKINEVRLKNNLITEQDEKGLFGESIEKLGQDRRLKILKTFGQITEKQYQEFIDIKNSRKPYLHLWSADLSSEKDDALKVFKKTFKLFKDITGIGLADAGSVKINPLMLKLFKDIKDQ
ncbi:MAG: hypothetical protein A3F21_03650 [Candidatus Portnoybacteria bacterium RIFCSPLOWO2_01_FULL_38_39]|uniref:Uncharacterized protein n=1 Tax=Candidatus Portnoybacteria bacterium RIFCSPHIGHO2_12_FULL_38_9 TaxID=1801997 RepID=A0A1G2FI69_9BACT|nr:MAG: hypothetical protein A3J64_03230 [Candidatus Portnoybacteria bacterium RIFCSPHIGHO2_12_FULL_38_9]OGZ38923.1 MAG: hypothetical protein A3F21_03650 [Candidatus Portnoybacteria bacterium RIFCSPLOWO2_01_FULL_38_39]